MRISDWSSDVCSSDLRGCGGRRGGRIGRRQRGGHGHSAALNEGERDTAGFGAPRWAAAKGLSSVTGSSATAASGSASSRCASARASSRSKPRSEEHTSELQSLMRISYAVFCLKKKKHNKASQALQSNQ